MYLRSRPMIMTSSITPACCGVTGVFLCGKIRLWHFCTFLHNPHFDFEPDYVIRKPQKQGFQRYIVWTEIFSTFHARVEYISVNPCPGNDFFATFASKWGVIWPPRHISSSRAHSNKIPTAIPIFSGSNFSMVPLPLLRDVDIRQKFKMAVIKIKCTDFTAVWLVEVDF